MPLRIASRKKTLWEICGDKSAWESCYQIRKEVWSSWLEEWVTENLVVDEIITITVENIYTGKEVYQLYPLEAAVFCNRWDMIEGLLGKGCRWHESIRIAMTKDSEQEYLVNELLEYAVEFYIVHCIQQQMTNVLPDGLSIDENEQCLTETWKKDLQFFDNLFAGMDEENQHTIVKAIDYFIMHFHKATDYFIMHFHKADKVMDIIVKQIKRLFEDIQLICPIFCQYYEEKVLHLQKDDMEEVSRWIGKLPIRWIGKVPGRRFPSSEYQKKILRQYLTYQTEKGQMDYVIRVLREVFVEWIGRWMDRDYCFCMNDHRNSETEIQSEFEDILNQIQKYCNRIPNGNMEYCTILLRIWKCWEHETRESWDKFGIVPIQKKLQELKNSDISVIECFWRPSEREMTFSKDELHILQYLFKHFRVYRYPMEVQEVEKRIKIYFKERTLSYWEESIYHSELENSKLLMFFMKSIYIPADDRNLSAISEIQKFILTQRSEEILLAAIDCGVFPEYSLGTAFQYAKEQKLYYSFPLLIQQRYDIQEGYCKNANLEDV